MALLIRNGEIVTVGSRVQADIYVENETITRIGKDIEAPPNAEIIDATGKLVFPGFIDPHVHIYLPFMATFAKDTHETGSIAALIGGTTTYIEMCCPNRNDDALEGYQLWKSKPVCSKSCSRMGGPAPNGTNPAVPNRSKPKARATSQHSSKIREPLAMWSICRVRKRCMRRSLRSRVA